jgi:diguanylate cyclase (GGDEF)-like protein
MTTKTDVKPVVLVVDDDPDIHNLLRVKFEGVLGYEFFSAYTYAEAVEVIKAQLGYMVVFVDIHLGGKESGLNLLSFIQETASHRVVAYAFTSDETSLVELKAVQAGALNVFRKDRDKPDRLLVYADQSLVLRLLRRGTEDEVTNLLSYSGFKDQVVPELRVARDRWEDGQHPSVFSLLLVSVDEYRELRDEYGHVVGDNLLRYITSLLKARFRPTDHLCRNGEDEFLVWIQGASEPQAQEAGLSLTANAVSNPFTAESVGELPVRLSTGVSEIRPATIARDADVELLLRSLVISARRSRG